MQTSQRPGRDQETGSRNHQGGCLSSEKCSRTDSHADAFVAYRTKCKAFIRRYAPLHSVEPVVRQHGNQIDTSSLETSNDSVTCFTLHNNHSFSTIIRLTLC